MTSRQYSLSICPANPFPEPASRMALHQTAAAYDQAKHSIDRFSECTRFSSTYLAILESRGMSRKVHKRCNAWYGSQYSQERFEIYPPELEPLKPLRQAEDDFWETGTFEIRYFDAASFCLSVFLSFCLTVFLSFCLSVFLLVFDGFVAFRPLISLFSRRRNRYRLGPVRYFYPGP